MQRLEARKRLLQSRADGYQVQLKHDAQFLVSQTPQLLKVEVVEKVAESNPVVAKIIASILGLSGSKKQESTISTIRSGTKDSDESTSPSPLRSLSRTLSTYILPAIYTVGTSRLLSYSLRSVGSLVRNGLKRVFGIRSKKRRK